MPVAPLGSTPGLRRRLRRQALGFALVTGAAGAVALPGVWLLGEVLRRGWPALGLKFLLAPPRDFLRAGGIGPAVLGSLLLLLGAAAVALPLGVGAALYLVHYARPGPVTAGIRVAVGGLAAVPPIVYGLFGFSLFAVAMGLGRTAAAGALTLGILVLPTVIAAAEEALAAVPREYREAALALGASRWQAARRVLLPLALPGIRSGAALALARAAGEAAPILFMAALFRAGPGRGLGDRPLALAYHLYAAATQVPGLPPERLYGAALVLLALVMGLMALALGGGGGGPPERRP